MGDLSGAKSAERFLSVKMVSIETFLNGQFYRNDVA